MEEVSNLFNELIAELSPVVSLCEDYARLSNTAPTHKGINLINLKNDIFQDYVMNLLHILLLRNDCRVPEPETVQRLIEDRVVLERLKPLEIRMQSHIDNCLASLQKDKDENTLISNLNAKLLEDVSSGSENEGIQDEDSENNIDEDIGDKDGHPDDNGNVSMESEYSEDSGEEQTKNGINSETNEVPFPLRSSLKKKNSSNKSSSIYVPPKINPVFYNDNETKLERRKEHKLKRILRSELMEEFDEGNAPEEDYFGDAAMLGQRDKSLVEREKYEEDNFIRLLQTKKDKRRQRELKQKLGSMDLGRVGKYDDVWEFFDEDDEGLVDKSKKSKRRLGSKKGGKTKKGLKRLQKGKKKFKSRRK